MAPAIAHFLVGASLLVLFAAPFALRYGADRGWVLLFVPVGGLWGLLPDVHNVAPVYRGELYALHGSPWVDLFALHYTLDTPLIRSLYIESVFASILLFSIAVPVFVACTHARGRLAVVDVKRGRSLASLLALGVAAGYAGFAAGVVLRVTGRLEPLAALVGADGLVVGGLLVGPFSLAGGVVFAVGLELLRPGERSAPLPRSVTAGVALAVAGWLLCVGIGVPLWMRVAVGTRLPVPYLPWDGLAGFVTYGAVFGAIYPTVRGTFVRR